MPSATVRRYDLQAEFKRRGLLQKAVAARIQVTDSHLSDVLNGRAKLTRRLARDISRATGIPLATILPNGQEAT
ncbi:hypothetical protein LCGC14_1761460 [marine sediment metagenome]|uniref:HTH cro/C1-type domain-containing protein n=1 Tax=marine sediment metagenome TaxID=412755 RepID=A0A0F9K0J0_9ZZZZ